MKGFHRRIISIQLSVTNMSWRYYLVIYIYINKLGKNHTTQPICDHLALSATILQGDNKTVILRNVKVCYRLDDNGRKCKVY